MACWQAGVEVNGAAPSRHFELRDVYSLSREMVALPVYGVRGGVARLLRHQPILTPNASESVQLATMLGDVSGQDPTSAARTIHRHCGAPLVVTLGERGALLLADGSETTVPPRQVQVRDTTGAGDTFNGVLAARLAAGEPLEQAVIAAGAAASLAVEHLGARTAMPTTAQIDAVLTARGQRLIC